MNRQNPKYQQMSISSGEQNYFGHFAMRYPVGGFKRKKKALEKVKLNATS